MALAVFEDLWRRREERRPVLIVVDEAHNLCSPDLESTAARAVRDHIIQIAAEGRKFGLWLLLSTQRPSKIHPQIVSQCDNLTLMRMNSPERPRRARRPLRVRPPGMLSQASRFRQGRPGRRRLRPRAEHHAVPRPDHPRGRHRRAGPDARDLADATTSGLLDDPAHRRGPAAAPARRGVAREPAGRDGRRRRGTAVLRGRRVAARSLRRAGLGLGTPLRRLRAHARPAAGAHLVFLLLAGAGTGGLGPLPRAAARDHARPCPAAVHGRRARRPTSAQRRDQAARPPRGARGGPAALRGTLAFVEPWNVTAAEVAVAQAIDVPILGTPRTGGRWATRAPAGDSSRRRGASAHWLGRRARPRGGVRPRPPSSPRSRTPSGSW